MEDAKRNNCRLSNPSSKGDFVAARSGLEYDSESSWSECWTGIELAIYTGGLYE